MPWTAVGTLGMVTIVAYGDAYYSYGVPIAAASHVHGVLAFGVLYAAGCGVLSASASIT